MFQVRRQTIAEIGFYIYLQYKIGMLSESLHRTGHQVYLPF